MVLLYAYLQQQELLWSTGRSLSLSGLCLDAGRQSADGGPEAGGGARISESLTRHGQ
jgi:hypothetical protein